jgi:hypothetical protein
VCLESVFYSDKNYITTYEDRFYSFKFEVLTTVTNKIILLCDVMPLTLVVASRYFGEKCHLSLKVRRLSQANNTKALACCSLGLLLLVAIFGHCQQLDCIASNYVMIDDRRKQKGFGRGLPWSELDTVQVFAWRK